MAVDYSQAEKDREMIIRMRQRATARSFERMRAKIDEQIATMNMSTVSERAKRQQLEEIRNELQKALGTFYSDLEDGLKSDMVSIGESVLSDSEAFYKSLNMPISMSITSFPVEIMENVINGTVYKEKWFLSSALWGDYQSKLDDINTVVSEGIGLNKSIYNIAKDLEKYVDPNARKDWSWAKVYPGTAKTVDYNAQRLARTLVSHAYQQNVVRQAQANPFASGVKWEASGGERMCEICEERDGKIFPVDDVPMDHPNGMCTFSVETPSMMEMSDILADWVNGEPTDWDDQLNAYYEGRLIEHKSIVAVNSENKESSNYGSYIPESIKDEVDLASASDDWFEYENASYMRDYIKDGIMHKQDMYGNEISKEDAQRLAAEAELIQAKAESTKTKYRTLYRGMVLDEEDARSMFTPGDTYIFDTLSATATDRGIASIYMNPENIGEGTGIPVILEIQKPDGIYGFDRDGVEVVLPKGSEFKVVRNYMDKDGVVHISLYAKKGKNVH